MPLSFDQWSAWRAFAPVACRERLPDDHPANTLRARRIASDLHPLRITPTVGVAWFPLAASAWPHGGIATVHARLGGPPTELGHTVARWLAMTLPVATCPVLTLEASRSAGVELEGASLELAALIATVSHLLHEAPRTVPLVSGRLSAEPSKLDAIWHVPAKRKAVAREVGGHDTAHQHYVEENGVDAEQALVPYFSEGWKERLRKRLELPAHQAVQRAWDLYQNGDRDAGEALLPPEGSPALADDPRARLRAAWLRAAMAVHRADPDALQRYADIESVIGRDRPLGANLVRELDAFIGIAEIDAGRPSQARARLETTRDKLLRAAPDPEFAPDPSWAWAYISVHGSLHRACVVCGDFGAAREALEASLAASDHLPGERARILGDLADVHRRQGDLDGARRLLEEARVALDATNAESRERTAAYQRVFRRRAGMDDDVVALPAGQTVYAAPVQVHLEWLAQARPAELGACVEELAAANPVLHTRFAVLMLLLGVGARALRAHPTVPQPWVARVVEGLCASGADAEVCDAARAVLAGEYGFGKRAGY